MQLALHIRADLGDAVRDFDRLEQEMRGVGEQSERAGRAAARAGRDIGRAGKQAAGAAGGLGRVAKTIGDFARAGAVGNLATAGIMRLLGSAKATAVGLVDAGLAAERLEQRFRLAFGGVAEGAREMEFVRAEAERLGLDLNTAAEGYSGLAAAARDTALEGGDAREVFTAIAEASRVAGLSTADMSDALTAVGRIMSDGKVSAEELRGQLGERLPGAFQIAARAMGVTTAELDRMLAAGELLAEDFLPLLAAQIRNELGDEVETVTDSAAAAMARFGTAITDLQGSIARSGVLDWLARVATAVSDVIRRATPAESFAGNLELLVAADKLSQSIQPQTRAVGRPQRAELISRIAETVARDPGLLTARRAELRAEIKSRRAEIDAIPEEGISTTARRGSSKIETTRTESAEEIREPLEEKIEKAETLLSLLQEIEQAARLLGLDDAALAAAAVPAPEPAPASKPSPTEAAAISDAERLRAESVRRLAEITESEWERLDRLEAERLAQAAADEKASVAEREAAMEAIRAEYRERRRQLDAAEAAERRAEAKRRDEEEAAEHQRRAETAAHAAAERRAARERDDPATGAATALRSLADEAGAAGRNAADAVTGSFRAMGNAVTEFVTTGRFEFGKFADSIIADMARIAVRQTLVAPLAQGFAGALGSLFGGAPAPAPAIASAGNVFHAAWGAAHGGGVAGAFTGRRDAAPWVFAAAPRLHGGGIAGGLQAGEVPAILERGEGVFTPAQMAALSPAAPEVRIEIRNEGRRPIEADEQAPRFDGERWVVGLVVRDLDGGGPIRSAVRRAAAPGGGAL